MHAQLLVFASPLSITTRRTIQIHQPAGASLAQLDFHLHHQHRLSPHLRAHHFFAPPPRPPPPFSPPHSHPAVLALPAVKTSLRDPVPSAQLSRLHPAFGLLQDGDDLLFAESTLPHDSSSWR